MRGARRNTDRCPGDSPGVCTASGLESGEVKQRKCRVREFLQRSERERLPVIDLQDVRASLDGHPVIEAVTLAVREGTFVGIIGPNGAGKTTLIRVILGLVPVDGGTVRVLGMSPGELRHELHHIGYMPQTVLFDPTFPVSVYDVVMMGRACCIGTFRIPGKADREAVMESIDRVGLDGLESVPIGELSGGQQRRVFLARAICLETRILLLDEPTAGLDVETQERFLNLLSQLKREMGLSVVFVSHDVNVLARFADEIVLINRTVYMQGTPEEVLGSERLKDIYRCEFDFLGASHRNREAPGGS
jgi:ABC-type Mn2+/Zn2+ transport system ATPase subunit